MSTPLIILSGKAGVGKDYVGAILARDHGAVCIAQADPLKRAAHRFLGFTLEQLWGPSEARNAPDTRSTEELSRIWTESLGEQVAWGRELGFNFSQTETLQGWFRDFVLKPRDKAGCITARSVLQTLGTEWGRKLKPDVWVDYAQETAFRALAGNLSYDPARGLIQGTKSVSLAVITDGRFRNEILATKRNGGVAIKIEGPGETSLSGTAATHASETEMDGIPRSWFDGILFNDRNQPGTEGRVEALLYSFKLLRDR